MALFAGSQSGPKSSAPGADVPVGGAPSHGSVRAWRRRRRSLGGGKSQSRDSRGRKTLRSARKKPTEIRLISLSFDPAQTSTRDVRISPKARRLAKRNAGRQFLPNGSRVGTLGAAEKKTPQKRDRKGNSRLPTSLRPRSRQAGQQKSQKFHPAGRQPTVFSGEVKSILGGDFSRFFGWAERTNRKKKLETGPGISCHPLRSDATEHSTRCGINARSGRPKTSHGLKMLNAPATCWGSFVRRARVLPGTLAVKSKAAKAGAIPRRRENAPRIKRWTGNGCLTDGRGGHR